MKVGLLRAMAVVLVSLAGAGLGRAAPLPVLDDKPVLQVDPGGPSAAVTALAFSRDGKTLYAGGLDKVVRVWRWRDGRFVLAQTLRVPIGPGTGGAINAIAVSPDGDWLAIAGRSPMRGETGFQRTGVIVEAAALTPEQLGDAGLIYIASTNDPSAGKVLRGHRGEVRALAFAPARAGKPPLLVSAATEREGSRRYGGLRLWNVETGKSLADRTDLPTRVEPPPGLAVWHTGAKPEQVRVAVAWPPDDDKDKVSLHVWIPTVAASEAIERWEADRYTRPLALLAQDGDTRLLLGGLGPKEGRLQVWNFGQRVTSETVATFPPRGKIHFVPDALAAVSAKYAAAILRPTADEDNQLALIDVDAAKVVARVPLAHSDRANLPVLAAVPRGPFVAVADADDHSIRVFAIADLLAGKTESLQVLEGAGLTPRSVAFANKGHGIWLSTEAKAKALQGGLYFDLDKGRLSANDGRNLTADTPALGEWSITVDKEAKAVRVRRGEKTYPPVLLNDKEVVTAAALRPTGDAGPAMLAVAFTDRDNARTLILLRRPEDDTPFRYLIGHLQDVRQLAFSKTRPLLASVAEDQTVCVWGLTDLDKGVGQVRGLGVADVDGKAVVRAVEAGGDAAKAGLAKGDELEAVGSPGGELRAVRSAVDFVFAVSARRPGDQLEVKVKGKRDAVTLPVGRGVDGWKPLFSLFLQREPVTPRPVGERGWVGWSPAGPYDASSEAAEACVGWHTNTGNPAAPVEFVRAGEHRKEYYRHGILGLLAEEADLAKALKRDDARHVPPEPALQPRRPEKAVPTKQDDVFLVREAVPAVRIGINADYPVTDAHVLKWSVRRVDGGNVTEKDAEAAGGARRDGGEWNADLSAIVWKRGEYELRFSLHPTADAPSVATKGLTLRYQPPAPMLALQLAGKDVSNSQDKPLTVMDDKLTFQLVLGAEPGQKVDVSFEHSVNGLVQPTPKPLSVEAGKHTQEFSLRKGLNMLRIRAVNSGALAGHEREETTSALVWVRYQAPNELPPRITVVRVDPAAELRTLDKKEVQVVDRPRVRLDVRIDADGPLVQADWARGDADPKSVLPVKDAGKTLDFPIELDLKAGEVVPLRLRAKSKNSDLSTSDVAVVFQPPLPRLTADALKSPDVLEPKVTLTGTIRAATADPFEVAIRVTPEQGSTKEMKEFKAKLSPDKQAWSAELLLPPGRSKVEAFVRNQWRGEQPDQAVDLQLRYRRPPRIIEAKPVTAVDTALVDLPLRIQSPEGMPLRQITVDGQRYRTFTAKPVEQKDGWVTWQVTVPRVPVSENDGKLDQLHVVAHNDDGPFGNAALVRETILAVTHKVVLKPADARFVGVKDFTQQDPQCNLPYRVESDSPLEAVELRRGDETLYKADLAKVKKEGKRFVLDEEVKLTLNVGTNNLDLVALNAGGQARASLVVNIKPPAVSVVVDQIVLRSDKGDPEGPPLKPERGADGTLKFPKVPRSLVWLEGHVTWSDPQAKQLDAPDLSVALLVGGYQQFPVALEPRGKGEQTNVRRFNVPAVLTTEDNTVKVTVKQGRPGAETQVAQQALSTNTYQVSCANPAKEQRLHLLIVGVNVSDGPALAKRMLDTLLATTRPAGLQGDFKTEAFARCILYRVLVGEVERGKVEAQLVEINKEITRLRRDAKPVSDVVMIYYQGEDVVKNGELWLKTSRNLQYPGVDPETYAIPYRSLPRIAGAQLLLLNVVGEPESRLPGLGGREEMGVLRYAKPSAKNAPAPEVVLQSLQEGMRKEHLLGRIAARVNDLVSKLDISALAALSKELAMLPLSGAAKGESP
jgi:WD40 repeat protein